MEKVYFSFITIPGKATTWRSAFNAKPTLALPAETQEALCKTEIKYAPVFYLGDAFSAKPWISRVPHGYN